MVVNLVHAEQWLLVAPFLLLPHTPSHLPSHPYPGYRTKETGNYKVNDLNIFRLLPTLNIPQIRSAAI